MSYYSTLTLAQFAALENLVPFSIDEIISDGSGSSGHTSTYAIIDIIHVFNVSQENILLHIEELIGSPYFRGKGFIQLKVGSSFTIEEERLDLGALINIAKKNKIIWFRNKQKIEITGWTHNLNIKTRYVCHYIQCYLICFLLYSIYKNYNQK